MATGEEVCYYVANSTGNEITMRYSTPLRYPGGKGKLANFVSLLMRDNNLLDGHYVEPFAGGAGIALSLLFHEIAIHIHINDLNRSVFSFWHSVLYETEPLCRMISDSPVTIEQWRAQRLVQANPENHSLLELGFSTFYLNRTNRSGIIKAGVIGGLDQTGNYKIDARFNKPALIDRIKLVSRYSNRISIYNEDATNFLLSTVSGLPDNTLVYLDPPYYVKGKELYENHFCHQDHQNLSKVVKESIRQNWIVSYDFVPEIAGLYCEYRQIDYLLNYSAADKYKGSELMVFDDNLEIPDVENPGKVKSYAHFR